MPADDELLVEDVLVVDELHEGARILLHVGVLVHEELDDGLEEVLDADLAVEGDQVKEHLLVVGPVLDDVALSREDAANQDVVAELD